MPVFNCNDLAEKCVQPFLANIRAVLIIIMIKTLPKMAFAAAFFFTKLPFQTYFNVTFFITFVFNLGQRKNE